MAEGLKVRFWGVRGSISCSGAEYARYGGNTSCLEVTAGGRRLIFDAGTGIRPLGLELARLAPLDIDIYFTHTHLDHLSGLTFFAPLFDARNSVRMWAGHLEAPYTLKKVVSNLMQAPIYPVTLDDLQGPGELHRVQGGRPAALRHGQDADGAAQPSQWRDRLSHRAWRQVDLLHHRHRAPAGRARQDHRRAVPRRRHHDLRLRATPTPSTSATRAGAIRPGRRACAWPMRPVSARSRSSITIPATTTPSWTTSRARRRRCVPGTVAGGLPRVIVAHEGLTLAP